MRLQQGGFVSDPCVSLCRVAPARGGVVPGRPPPQRGFHQLLPPVCCGAPRLSILQAGRYAAVASLNNTVE